MDEQKIIKEKRKSVFQLVAIVVLAVILFSAVYFIKHSMPDGGLLAASLGGRALLPLIVIAALIDSVNPCAFSVLFLTIAFLFSLGRTRKNIIFTGGAYVLGVFVVYVLIGLGVLKTLQFLNIPHFVARIGGAILIFSGLLNLANHFFPNFPIRIGIPSSVHRKIALFVSKASVPSAFTLGFLVGVWEFPCTGGPYLLVLGLLHDHSTFFSGLGYLVLYNAVFVLPLIIILAIAGNEILLKKAEEWKKDTVRGRIIGGIAMLILGGLIFIL